MDTKVVGLSNFGWTLMFVPGKESKKMALKKVEQVCSIPFRSTLYPSYFHSFGMTENYIVFVEQPFKLDILKLATAYFRGINWGTCLKFDKDDIVSDCLFPFNGKSGRHEKSQRWRDDCFLPRRCFTSSTERRERPRRLASAGTRWWFFTTSTRTRRRATWCST